MLEVILCITTLGALSGCATPGYNPPRLESELEHAGATPAQARCVTDGLSAKFDEGQLGSHSAPSLLRPAPKASDPPGTIYENEYESTRDILTQCKVTLPLNPLPS
jgi:hypothetical protein